MCNRGTVPLFGKKKNDSDCRGGSPIIAPIDHCNRTTTHQSTIYVFKPIFLVFRQVPSKTMGGLIVRQGGFLHLFHISSRSVSFSVGIQSSSSEEQVSGNSKAHTSDG